MRIFSLLARKSDRGNAPEDSPGVRGYVRACWHEFPILFPASASIALAAFLMEGAGIALVLPLFASMQGHGSGKLLVAIAALFVVKAALLFASRQLGTTMVSEWRRRWYERLYRKLLRASYSHFLSRNIGTLVHATTTEADRVCYGMSNVLSLVSLALSTGIYLGLALFVDPTMTLATGALGIGSIVLFAPIIRQGRKLGRTRRDAMESVHGLLHESLSAIQLVKAMGKEDAFDCRLGHESRSLKSVMIRTGANEAILAVAYEPAIVLTLCIAVFAGLSWFESLDIAAFLIVAALLYRSYTRISAIPPILHGIESTVPSYELLEKVHREAFEAAERREPVGTRIEGSLVSLVMERVSYSYGESRILSDIELEIRRGERLALVGVSGAGKSTLALILLGLLAEYEGEIRVNDTIRLADLDLVDWRRRIGYVSQECFLFDATVEENVSFYSAMSREEVVEALKAAGAWEFVSGLSLQERTPIGDRGTRISGGERQKLALARALARRPELLVLDEATSELDSESERRIEESLDRIRPSTAVVVAAHRLSTVRGADRILVLERGRIVERGTFDELVRAKGVFERFVRSQDLSAKVENPHPRDSGISHLPPDQRDGT